MNGSDAPSSQAVDEVLIKFVYKPGAELAISGLTLVGRGRDLTPVNDVLSAFPVTDVRFSYPRLGPYLREKQDSLPFPFRDESVHLDLFVRVFLSSTGKASSKAAALADELEPLISVPDSEIDRVSVPGPLGPSPQDREGDQSYLDPSTYEEGMVGGVDARYAWTFPDSAGAGADMQVMVVDEAYRAELHPDLEHVVVLKESVTTNFEHAVNSLGVIGARRNGEYISGLAHGAQNLFFFPHNNNRNDIFDVVETASLGVIDGHEAVDGHATANLSEGDVLVIEATGTSLGKTLPIDVYDDVRAGIAALSKPIADGGFFGLVVVIPAGNGNVHLTPMIADGGKAAWSGETGEDDSGAILVGAGHSGLKDATQARMRRGTSSHGIRVDCQGWGDGVITTSLALASTAPNPEQIEWDYNGTSAATALVAGVVACFQGIAKANGALLTARNFRSLLREVGADQVFAPGDDENDMRIGPLPDLGAMAGVLGLVPDCYVRDSVLDEGAEPNPHVFYRSPDIITRSAAVADPEAELGESSLSNEFLSEDVAGGQRNLVYVRMQNRGQAPDDYRVRLFRSSASTFIHPANWRFVGEVFEAAIEPGKVRVAAPIPWTPPNMDVWYCLIVVIDSPRDQVQIPSTFVDSIAYSQWVLDHNNVAFRNVKVVKTPAVLFAAQFQFKLSSHPQLNGEFRFEIRHNLPPGTKITVEVAKQLWRNTNAGPIELDLPRPGHPLIRSDARAIILRNVILPAAFDVPVALRFDHDSAVAAGLYSVAVDQYMGPVHLGRVTLLIDAWDRATLNA